MAQAQARVDRSGGGRSTAGSEGHHRILAVLAYLNGTHHA
jgi:hypothetical protein